MTPRDYVLGYLEQAFPIHAQKLVEIDGNMVAEPLRDETGALVVSREALALRDAAMMELMTLAPIPSIPFAGRTLVGDICAAISTVPVTAAALIAAAYPARDAARHAALSPVFAAVAPPLLTHRTAVYASFLACLATIAAPLLSCLTAVSPPLLARFGSGLAALVAALASSSRNAIPVR